MAVRLNGLSSNEILWLTLAMRDSGNVIQWPVGSGIVVDKHSTGGVGDKVTLIVLPILAAAGLKVLKMSGRGLGHTGGTIDKLESIPGLRLDLTAPEALQQTLELNCAIIGQSPSMVPADKKLYGLRDVTETVDSIPLIASSIMSKKLAGNPTVIVLDVKFGSGAFMKDIETARELAKVMVSIGVGAGVKTVAALTSMEEPLGFAVGNALEITEAVDILSNKPDSNPSLRELCIALSALAMIHAGVSHSDLEARETIDHIISSGKALETWNNLIAAQGYSQQNPILESLPKAPVTAECISPASGYITSIDARRVGEIAMQMGAGREIPGGPIDHSVGIWFRKKCGDAVEAGSSIATLHINSPSEIEKYSILLLEAIRISEIKPEKSTPILELVGQVSAEIE